VWRYAVENVASRTGEAMKERYESAEHFIMCNSRVCPECDELRVNYELNESGVCVYCEDEGASEEERNEEHYYRALDKEALDKAYKEKP
jgi:hypothetical protein